MLLCPSYKETIEWNTKTTKQLNNTMKYSLKYCFYPHKKINQEKQRLNRELRFISDIYKPRFNQDFLKPIFHETNLVKSWQNHGKSWSSLVRTN